MYYLLSKYFFPLVQSDYTTRKDWRPQLTIFLIVVFTTAKISAQCVCNSTLVVGTGAPIPYPTLSSAPPAVQNPGATCVKVIGTFTIDAGMTWNLGPATPGLSIVAFATPSSALIIQAGGKVIANRTVFMPCANQGSSWQGTFVQAGGQIETDDARFIDASTAGISVVENAVFKIKNTKFVTCNKGLRIIGVHNSSNHIIDNNEFYNCGIGIHLNTAQNITITNSHYLVTLANFIMTGIHSEGFSKNIISDHDLFDNQNRCVDLIKTENFRMTNAVMNNSTAGLFAMECTGKLLVQDSKFNGTQQMGIQVNYHTVTANADLELNHNDFVNHGVGHDIYLKDISGSGSVLVNDQDIDLPAPQTMNGTGTIQCGIFVEKFFANGGIQVTNNLISHNSAALLPPGGILLSNFSAPAILSGNTVTSTGSSGMPFQMQAVNCRNNLTFSNNNLNGGSPNASSNLRVLQSPGKLTLCCNILNNGINGLYLNGPLNDASIWGTDFGFHAFAGMYLDNASFNSTQQFLQGNDWSGATGANGIYINNSTGIPGLPDFVVSTGNFPQGPTWVTVIGSGTVADWLDIQQATEPVCGTFTCVGGNTSNGDIQQGTHDRNNSSTTESSAFSAFPNPADDQLFLQVPVLESAALVRLIDPSGRISQTLEVPAGASSISLETGFLPAGLYIVQYQAERQAPTTKLVVVRHP
jgi:hypothetical protein